jgi:hypothetical protein
MTTKKTTLITVLVTTKITVFMTTLITVLMIPSKGLIQGPSVPMLRIILVQPRAPTPNKAVVQQWGWEKGGDRGGRGGKRESQRKEQEVGVLEGEWVSASALLAACPRLPSLLQAENSDELAKLAHVWTLSSAVTRREGGEGGGGGGGEGEGGGDVHSRRELLDECRRSVEQAISSFVGAFELRAGAQTVTDQVRGAQEAERAAIDASEHLHTSALSAISSNRHKLRELVAQEADAAERIASLEQRVRVAAEDAEAAQERRDAVSRRAVLARKRRVWMLGEAELRLTAAQERCERAQAADLEMRARKGNVWQHETEERLRMRVRVQEEMAKELARKTLEKEQELSLLQLQVKTAEQVKRMEEQREQQAAHDRQLILTKANAATPPAPAGHNNTSANAAAGARLHGAECVNEPSRSSILGERPWHTPHVAVQQRLDYLGSGGRGRRVLGGKTGRSSGSGIPSRDGRAERGGKDKGGGEGLVYVDIDPEHVPLLLDDLLLERDVEEGDDEEEETETWQQRRAQRVQEEKKKLKLLLACYHKALLNIMLYYAKAQRVREVCVHVYMHTCIHTHTYIYMYVGLEQRRPRGCCNADARGRARD